MNSTNFHLFRAETTEAITIYIFLLIILLCFIRYFIFRTDTESRGVQKIIGGLAVFVVALLSKNLWIQSLSLFIGGLIIASEDFMQKLAIIVRSESQDLSKNLSTTTPTKEELEQKREKEIKELQQNSKEKKKMAPRTALLRTVVLSESLVADYFKSKVGNMYREETKFTGTEIIVDGIIVDTHNKVSKIVEIKPLKTLDNADEIIKFQTQEIKREIPNIPIIVCLILENSPLKSEVKELVSEMRKYDNVTLGIFYIKQEKLIPVLEPLI